MRTVKLRHGHPPAHASLLTTLPSRQADVEGWVEGLGTLAAQLRALQGGTEAAAMEVRELREEKERCQRVRRVEGWDGMRGRARESDYPRTNP